MPNFKSIGLGISEPQVAENRYLPSPTNMLHCDKCTVHVHMNQKQNIIPCRPCRECNHQVLHKARTPSQCHSDQSHILLHAVPRCSGVAAYAFVLPSSVLGVFCQFYRKNCYVTNTPYHIMWVLKSHNRMSRVCNKTQTQ